MGGMSGRGVESLGGPQVFSESNGEPSEGLKPGLA